MVVDYNISNYKVYKMKIIVCIFNAIVCGVILVGCSDNRDIEEKISSLQSQPIKTVLG